LKRSGIFSIVLMVICPVTAIFAAESQWVRTGVTGRLINVPDAEGDRILDFSDVGYKGRGAELIPNNVPNVQIVSPVAGDDTATIQAAINAVAAMPLGADGFRGAVLLNAGDYDINTQLTIGASGIVLRGVGDNSGQTVLHARGTTQRSLIQMLGAGSQSFTGNPKRNMIDKVVPAGATSFRVDSTSGLAVGDTVRVERPSTANWIAAVGMDNPPDGDPPWDPGTMNIRFDRVVTRIEGNRIFLDAPLANSFELQYGGGTIQHYSWPGRIENVGVENLRAESDFASDTDEDHAWEFVSIENAQNVWVRHTTSQYFANSAVLSNPTAKWVAVQDVTNLDPKSTVTGERRYTFDLSGQLDFVTDSQANSGRHDFVNNSTRPPGPHVFHNSVANNALNDSGPHQRWATGTLFDNITVHGDNINAKNNGSLGTTHGWSASNVVIWNSTADGFTVQNPPTSQNWLIGSTGPVINDTQFGQQPAGYVDSPGVPVTAGGTNSLYDAQMNDSADIREFHWGGSAGNWTEALKWKQGVTPAIYRVSSRDYLLGDIDGYTNDGASSVDAAYIDPAWRAAIQNSSALPITGFDDTAGNKNVAFTIQHQLDAGERVVHGYLALGLKQSGDQVSSDFIRLFDMSAAHRLDFTTLGWDSKVNSASTYVGVIDLGSYLDQLQSGSVNVQINDDTAADWGMYVVTVAKPVADSIGPTVFLDGGGTSVVNSTVTGLHALQVGGASTGNLQIQSTGTVHLGAGYVQLANGSLSLELNASTLGHPIIQANDAELNGSLSVQLASGYSPAVGNVFGILDTSGNVQGEFNTVVLPALASGLAWDLVYNTSSVALRVLLQGDYNRDNRVDAADYVVWRRTFNQTVPNGEGADGNYDGVINGLDYSVWRANFGATVGTGTSTTSVPEPAGTIMFVASAMSATLWRRRRPLPKHRPLPE
jgi:Dockerin type I domain